MRRFKKNNNLAKVFYSVFGSLPLLVTLYLYPLIPFNGKDLLQFIIREPKK